MLLAPSSCMYVLHSREKTHFGHFVRSCAFYASIDGNRPRVSLLRCIPDCSGFRAPYPPTTYFGQYRYVHPSKTFRPQLRLENGSNGCQKYSGNGCRLTGANIFSCWTSGQCWVSKCLCRPRLVCWPMIVWHLQRTVGCIRCVTEPRVPTNLSESHLSSGLFLGRSGENSTSSYKKNAEQLVVVVFALGLCRQTTQAAYKVSCASSRLVFSSQLDLLECGMPPFSHRWL